MKTIPGFHGDYAVLEDGRVYSRKSAMFLKHKVNFGGYHTVILKHGSPQKTLRVHRLVAQAYLPNPYNYQEVNHKDRNKSNNHVSNLEWCTREQNMQHTIAMDKVNVLRLQNEQLIRLLLKKGVSVEEISRVAGLNPSKVLAIKHFNIISTS